MRKIPIQVLCLPVPGAYLKLLEYLTRYLAGIAYFAGYARSFPGGRSVEEGRGLCLSCGG